MLCYVSHALLPMLLTGLMNITKNTLVETKKRIKKKENSNYRIIAKLKEEREKKGVRRRGRAGQKRAQHSHRIDSIKFENNIRSIGTHKFPFDHYKYGIFFFSHQLLLFHLLLLFMFLLFIAIIVNIVVIGERVSCALIIRKIRMKFSKCVSTMVNGIWIVYYKFVANALCVPHSWRLLKIMLYQHTGLIVRSFVTI